MTPLNTNNKTQGQTYPRNIFERRIFCGVCGEMMLRTSLRKHSPERAVYCPVCVKDPSSPGYNFHYPFYDLIWEAYKTIHKERRTALRTAEKIEAAYQDGRIARVDQFYKEKMTPIIEKIRQNTISMNQLFLDMPIDEPFSLDHAKNYVNLQNQAVLLTEKLAVQSEALLDFYDSLSLNNQWYCIFGQLPEDFTLTAELSRRTISTIILTPGQHPQFNLQRQAERTQLLNGLKQLSKLEYRIARKEDCSDGK